MVSFALVLFIFVLVPLSCPNGIPGKESDSSGTVAGEGGGTNFA